MIATDFILSGAVSPGKLLPSEGQLADHYGVSRITVRGALRILQETGMIAIRHGIGSKVLPRSDAVMNGLDRLRSLETFAVEAGTTVTTSDVVFNEMAADPDVAQRLALEPGTRILAVERVHIIGDDRVAWMVDYIPSTTMPFDVMRSEFQGSALDVLLAHPEIGLEYADATIVPRTLSAAIARNLGAKRSTAALFIDAVAYTAAGDPIELAHSWMLPDYFRFSVRRRR